MTDLFHCLRWTTIYNPWVAQGGQLTMILDGCVQHRPWFSDAVWAAGEEARRRAASDYLAETFLKGILWEVWRDSQIVGIFQVTDIRPGLDAQCHFIFFDRSLVNKRQLCRRMMAQTFEDERLTLHALRVDLPLYAAKLSGFLRKALGFRYEAERRLQSKDLPLELAKSVSRRHEAVKYNGQWQDVLLFSVTKDEFFREWSKNNAGGCQHGTDAGTDAGGSTVPPGTPGESRTSLPESSPDQRPSA